MAMHASCKDAESAPPRPHIYIQFMTEEGDDEAFADCKVYTEQADEGRDKDDRFIYDGRKFFRLDFSSGHETSFNFFILIIQPYFFSFLSLVVDALFAALSEGAANHPDSDGSSQGDFFVNEDYEGNEEEIGQRNLEHYDRLLSMQLGGRYEMEFVICVAN